MELLKTNQETMKNHENQPGTMKNRPGTRYLHFGFETSRFRHFFQFFEGFGFRKFGLGKKVSVSVSEKFGLGKKCRFRFRKIWSQKKSTGFGFGKIWSWKKVSVSVLENLVL